MRTLGLAERNVRAQEDTHPKRGTPRIPAMRLGATVTTQECPGLRDVQHRELECTLEFNLRTAENTVVGCKQQQHLE